MWKRWREVECGDVRVQDCARCCRKGLGRSLPAIALYALWFYSGINLSSSVSVAHCLWTSFRENATYIRQPVQVAPNARFIKQAHIHTPTGYKHKFMICFPFSFYYFSRSNNPIYWHPSFISKFQRIWLQSMSNVLPFINIFFLYVFIGIHFVWFRMFLF